MVKGASTSVRRRCGVRPGQAAPASRPKVRELMVSGRGLTVRTRRSGQGWGAMVRHPRRGLRSAMLRPQPVNH
jgi:hypothetical protein